LPRTHHTPNARTTQYLSGKITHRSRGARCGFLKRADASYSGPLRETTNPQRP